MRARGEAHLPNAAATGARVSNSLDWHHAGQDGGSPAVQQRANQQRADDADGYVPPGIGGLPPHA